MQPDDPLPPWKTRNRQLMRNDSDCPCAWYGQWFGCLSLESRQFFWERRLLRVLRHEEEGAHTEIHHVYQLMAHYGIVDPPFIFHLLITDPSRFAVEWDPHTYVTRIMAKDSRSWTAPAWRTDRISEGLFVRTTI